MVRKQKYKPPKNPQKDEAMELVAQVEKKKSEIGVKWGEHRFLNLLDPDLKNRMEIMTNKYKTVKAGINYYSTAEMARGMLRGYEVCEQNVIDRGHEELNGEIWSYFYKRANTEFLLVKDDAFYPKAVAMAGKEDPPPVVCSLVELMRLIPQDNWIFIHKLKKEIPGSKVIEPLTKEDKDNYPLITSFDI